MLGEVGDVGVMLFVVVGTRENMFVVVVVVIDVIDVIVDAVDMDGGEM